MNETRKLSAFAAGLTYETLPTTVVARTKELILDQLTIQVGVSRKPWLRVARDYVMQQGGRPEATISGYGDVTTAENAAFVNGAVGHGFELDDVYAPALSHPGPVVVPAALAVAQREGASGKELLTAVVAGYEVMGRVGRALSPTYLYRGFHPTSASGAIGAAASTGRLLKLDVDTMVNGLAVAASFLCGLTECFHAGGEIKRYHAGIAAAGGVRAVGLAALGLTGPATALEGSFGIRAFSDDFQVEALLDRLGQQFVVLDIWQKKYGCNGMIHAPIDAVEAIRTKHGLAVEEIEEIVIGSNRHGPQEVGSIRTPEDVFGFQFSIYYAMALQLVRGGGGLYDYAETDARDPALAELAQRIRIEVNEAIDRQFPGKIGGTVTLRTKDGRRFSETVEDCRGTPGNPMSEDERLDKARRVAGMTMPADKVERLIQAVERLEAMENVRAMGKLVKC